MKKSKWYISYEELRKSGWQGDITGSGFVPAEQMRITEFFEGDDKE